MKPVQTPLSPLHELICHLWLDSGRENLGSDKIGREWCPDNMRAEKMDFIHVSTPKHAGWTNWSDLRKRGLQKTTIDGFSNKNTNTPQLKMGLITTTPKKSLAKKTKSTISGCGMRHFWMSQIQWVLYNHRSVEGLPMLWVASRKSNITTPEFKTFPKKVT